MASIDDLFRKSTTPSSSISTTNKRKFPDHTQSPAYKSAKISTNGTPHTTTVEDGDDANVEAGPSLPPTETDDAAEDDDDEEGRFFGSGVSADTRQALDYVEGTMDGELGAGEEEVIDAAWLRRMAVGFERRITRNAELRARFEAEPEKYVGLLFSCYLYFVAGLGRLSVRWFMELWLILSFWLQVYDI